MTDNALFSIESGFDTIHNAATTLENPSRQEILPPKTPSFPNAPEFESLIKLNDMSPCGNYNYAFKTRAKEYNRSYNAKELALLKDLTMSLYLKDIIESEYLEEEIGQIIWKDVGTKFFDLSDEDEIRKTLSKICQFENKLFPRLHYAMPFTSRLYQESIKGIFLLIEKMMKQAKKFIENIQAKLKIREELPEENRLLLEKNKKLEEEIQQLKYQIESAAKIAVSASKQDATVVKQVSKDLNQITGNLQTQNQGLYNQIKEEIANATTKIREQTLHQNSAVTDLVETAKESILQSMIGMKDSATKLPAKNSVGIQVKKSIIANNSSSEESKSYWEFFTYLECVLTPLPRDKKSYSQLQIISTIDSLCSYILNNKCIERASMSWNNSKLNVSKCNLFDSSYNELRYSILAFFQEQTHGKSDIVYKEYISFISAIQELNKTAVHPINFLTLDLIDSPYKQVDKSHTFRNYILIIFLKNYEMFSEFW